MSTEVKKRVKRVALVVILFILCGLAYALVVSLLGFGIPCIFRLVTGFRCPGCGITHAALCFLKLDIVGAVRANAFIIPIVLFVGWVLGYSTVRYIKKGFMRLDSGSRIADIGFLILLLVWWVVRNVIGI